MAATLVTQIGLPRSGMYRNILGALEIIGRKLGYGLDTAVSGASNLFFNAEQGAWYDPSDFSTLFQDSAGTTPVTAVEQPVGKILDKSGRGNHATQSTAASRPVLSARVSLLTYSEDFSNAAWTKANATVTANSVVAPDGTTTADTLLETAVNSFHNVSLSYTGGNVAYTYSVCLKASGRTQAVVAMSDLITGDASIKVDLTTGVLTSTGLAVGSWTGISSSVSSDASGFFRVTISGIRGAGTTTAIRVSVLNDGGSTSYLGDITKGICIWGADLRVANTGANLPAYQRVNTATDYDTVGFPHYLKFDGIDDSLSTASIDFTSTDKMTVFAGVRKLSDAAVGTILELSANSSTTAGSMALFGPRSNGITKYGIHLNGSTANERATDTAFAAPITSVLVASFDIAATTELSLRVSRVAQALSVVLSSGDAGTGNLGNHTLYVGSRGGTTLPFNGHLYSLIIRGAQSTVSQIAAAESYVNSKTGAY